MSLLPNKTLPFCNDSNCRAIHFHMDTELQMTASVQERFEADKLKLGSKQEPGAQAKTIRLRRKGFGG
jgi:hypothetical protein